MPDRISLDWLSVTFHIQASSDYPLCFDHIRGLFQTDIEFTDRGRLRGYSKGGFILDGLGLLGFDPKRLEMGVHIRLSSEALGALALRLGASSPDDNGVVSWDFTEFFRLLENRPKYAIDYPKYISYSRVDFAFDDTSGLLDLDHINFVAEEKFIPGRETNWVTTRFRQGGEQKNYSEFPGRTIVYGDRSSEVFVRFYDKAAQKKIQNFSWVRAEVEYKGDRADLIVSALLSSGLPALSESFMNYISFRDRPAEGDISRWPLASWWVLFLDTSKSISLSCGSALKSVKRLSTWAEKQLACALALISEAMPGKIDELIESGKKRFKAKHYNLLKAHYEQVQAEVYAAQLEFVLGGDVTEDQAEFNDWVERVRYSKENAVSPRVPVLDRRHIRLAEIEEFNASERLKNYISPGRWAFVNQVSAIDF